MMDQIAGMCRDAASREVAWRPDDGEAQVAGYRHRNHVLVDYLA